MANGIGAGDAGRLARDQLFDVTGLKTYTISAVGRSDDGWTVSVDVIERTAIPDAQDVMATYEVKLDPDGTMLGYKRKRRFLRRDLNVGDEE